MKPGKLARSLLRVLAALAALTAVAVLDWYPTVKDLGRLRRERGDLERKIRDYAAIATKFTFPDETEKAVLANAEVELRRALPIVENDGAWMGLARTELLEREKGLANRISVFGGEEASGPGRPELTTWLKLQEQEIRQSLEAVDPWKRYPWRGLFLKDPPAGEWLASRPLCVALDVPPPVLFDFINRVSWGTTRLEIIHLRVEPAEGSARAWMVCRGVYRTDRPHARPVAAAEDEAGALLIDRDSPWLLQPVDPLLVPVVDKKELPPAGSPW